jgi:hypothetical protein
MLKDVRRYRPVEMVGKVAHAVRQDLERLMIQRSEMA